MLFSIVVTGEIEPCKLEVKAKAPIRRFAAMKELVGASYVRVACFVCANLTFGTGSPMYVG
jgi:hypothetical protein